VNAVCNEKNKKSGWFLQGNHIAFIVLLSSHTDRDFFRCCVLAGTRTLDPLIKRLGIIVVNQSLISVA